MFFGRAKKLKQVDRDVEHAGIIKDYYKALEIAGNECAPRHNCVLSYRICKIQFFLFQNISTYLLQPNSKKCKAML